MEHLEQYRVLGDYERKDSHQVDLYIGRIVHVIEKHDTGKPVMMRRKDLYQITDKVHHRVVYPSVCLLN